MKRFLINLMGNRTMGFKFIAAFTLVILIPMLFLAYISYRVIDARLITDARQKIDIGLKVAWTEYNIRADQMRYGMMQAASMDEIKNAIKQGNKEYLKSMMIRWKKERPYVDIWMVVNADGKVIARLNSDIAGDTLDINNLIEKAMLSGEPQISTEVIKEDMLKKENPEFHKQFIIPVISSPFMDEYKRPGKNIEDNTMALLVATPVHGEYHSFMGAILTADILNNDDYIPNTVADKVPGLFTTIAMDGLGIATNLKDSKGQNAKGTLLASSVMSVIKSGRPMRGELDALGNTYISAFDPIKDNKDRVIGSLFVGVPKSSLWSIQIHNELIIAVATGFGLILALFTAFLVTSKVTRPLKALKQNADAFAQGNMDARIDIDVSANTKDELKILARAFNIMMDQVKAKYDVEKRYLKELEEKNNQLGAVNEELSKTNEELEVTYEETQSQAEELHSANEELRLLNEDLDRKNRELIEANLVIKKDKEELKTAKDKLRLIYDGIKSYLLLVDEGCTILEANRYFIEDCRLKEPSVIGKKLYHIFGFNEEEYLKNCPVIKSIQTRATTEIELTTKDGKILHWHSFPLFEADGGPPHAVVYIEDITKQRLLLQRLIQSDKLSSLGELVSGVAHELNNPLTAIMGFSELLLNEAANEKTGKRLRNIHESSHICKRIVENLLSFARQHKPEKKYCNINKIITDTIELRAYQLKVDNIDIKLNFAASLPETMVDEHQLQQVLLNLINNAQHAIAEQSKKGTITISTMQEGKNLRLEVSDTGPGIPNGIISKIFDPFFTTKTVGKGTGLGLSISYGIIKEHGGNIYAMSTPGKGSTFVVELPIIEKQIEDQTTPAEINIKYKASGKGRRALILDDEPTILELLKKALSDDEFHVDTASRSEDALKMLEKASYDIIISDIKMPGMGGKEFYRALKSIRPAAVNNIIFMSGDSASQETQNFLKESGNLFLHKPFTIAQVKEIIAKKLSS